MNRLSRVLIVVCLVGIVAGPAVSGVRRDDRPDSVYQGTAATAPYAPVGSFLVHEFGGVNLASGTLIAPDYVLTAAHVVDQAESLTFTVGGRNYSASSWGVCPRWNENDLMAGYDIALVKLSEAVTGVTPAVRYRGFDEIGQRGTIVGYGMTGTGLTGARTADGCKRAGQQELDLLYAGLGDDARLLLTDFDNPSSVRDSLLGSSAPLGLEYAVAPGDSGGGMFVATASGAQLVGVTSFCWGALDGWNDSDYGDLSGFTRVSPFNSWIDQSIATWNGDGPASAVQGLVALPEPATLALLATGLAALLARRTRRRQRISHLSVLSSRTGAAAAVVCRRA